MISVIGLLIGLSGIVQLFVLGYFWNITEGKIHQTLRVLGMIFMGVGLALAATSLALVALTAPPVE